MADHPTRIRAALAAGPLSAGELRARLDVSRPTLARALATLPDEIVTWGAARATQYALRDRLRDLPDMPVYRVSERGRITLLGQLIPVRPEGFVMAQTDGITHHHEGLPWWLSDMRPQGFLGRAFARQQAPRLGLPADVRHWSDAHALRALLASGADAVGNLLIGDLARDHFVNAPLPEAVRIDDYPRLAQAALAAGDIGSSAGGEQPKFCAYTDAGHLLVKFTAPDDNPVTARWRDLLLAEHLALDTLRAAGVSAARSRIVDVGGQRFLELERFDRVGTHGRHAVLSLAALDGEFVGQAAQPWPVVTAALLRQHVITEGAHAGAALLYAFGMFIGNTDMHAGNLSFVSDAGRPYTLSPAYDMLPMAFSPTASGLVRDTLPATVPLHPSVDGPTWTKAHALASQYLARMEHESGLSKAFRPCVAALRGQMETLTQRIARVG